MSLAVNTQLELTLNAIMLPQLPPELTDRIIDFLWDDPAALHSCSLTARSWLSSSRFHLFSTLRIVNRRAYDRLAHLVINLPHMRPLFCANRVREPHARTPDDPNSLSRLARIAPSRHLLHDVVAFCFGHAGRV